MLSLRKTADLFGVDKAYVSRRVHANKPVKGHDIAKHAAFDSKGPIAGFNFPPGYPFPKNEDVRRGSLSGESRPESAVNRVNVDRPLHVDPWPVNQDSNGENPESEPGFVKPRIDVDESSINSIKTHAGPGDGGAHRAANKVLTPDDEDALWSILPENEPETEVNAVNVDRQSTDIDSLLDNSIDRFANNHMYKPTYKVPDSTAIAVNRVNVDRPLHVDPWPVNQDSNGENPESEPGFVKPRIDVDESPINSIKNNEFETGYDIANRVLTPDDEDALWSILPENEPETEVNAVNVDPQSTDIDSLIDNSIDRFASKNVYKHGHKVPDSTASTSYSSKLPVVRNGQQLDTTADLIEKNPWSESVLLSVLGLGILAFGVDYAVNKEESMASRFGRWLKEVSQPNETEPANYHPDMPWEEDQYLYDQSEYSINPARWHP